MTDFFNWLFFIFWQSWTLNCALHCAERIDLSWWRFGLWKLFSSSGNVEGENLFFSSSFWFHVNIDGIRVFRWLGLRCGKSPDLPGLLEPAGWPRSKAEPLHPTSRGRRSLSWCKSLPSALHTLLEASSPIKWAFVCSCARIHPPLHPCSRLRRRVVCVCVRTRVNVGLRLFNVSACLPALR